MIKPLTTIFDINMQEFSVARSQHKKQETRVANGVSVRCRNLDKQTRERLYEKYDGRERNVLSIMKSKVEY